MFDYASIEALVRSELDGCGLSRHGWRFEGFLLNPPRLIDARSGASSFQVWAVLQEGAQAASGGYTIAYDPTEEAFCLVTGGVAVSYYMSLLEAIDGM